MARSRGDDLDILGVRFKQQLVMRIALVFGGRNCEHEVSLRSAESVRETLQQSGHDVVDIGISQSGRWLLNPSFPQVLSNREAELVDNSLTLLPETKSQLALGEVDVVFPIVHGPTGEDGSIQGLLEVANVPYVGCGVLGSALAMDKDVAKRLLKAAGIPVTPYDTVQSAALAADESTILKRLIRNIGFPAFIKPANMGSSVGVSHVGDPTELKTALQQACLYDEKVLMEAAVPYVRELEISVLGWHELQASLPGEIRLQSGFYDYRAKYTDDSAELLIPAPVSSEIVSRLQNLAIEAFRVLEGCGMGRVDFLMNGQSHELFLNEVNTIPGFTSISMYPKLWEASGISQPRLMQILLDIALERHAAKQKLRTSFF